MQEALNHNFQDIQNKVHVLKSLGGCFRALDRPAAAALVLRQAADLIPESGTIADLAGAIGSGCTYSLCQDVLTPHVMAMH